MKLAEEKKTQDYRQVKVEIIEAFRDEQGHISYRTIFKQTFFSKLNCKKQKGDEE
jgi:hypothetical protein